MAPTQGAIPGVDTVLGTIGQVNQLLGAGLTILATYKAAREQWKAAHPTDQSPFLEDQQLNDLLRMDAKSLVAHVDDVIRKHTPPTGDPTGGE